MRDPDSERGGRIERAIVRYFSRMACRPTPFGLFAGGSVGTIGDRTRLLIEGQEKYQRRSRLDMDYLFELVEALGRDRSLRRAFVFRPNSSLYRAAGRVHYVEARLDGKDRTHHLVAAEDSDELRSTLARAADGAPVESLVTALVGDDVSQAEAEEYVEQLIESQILRPDVALFVTGCDTAQALAGQLSGRVETAEIGNRLEKARTELSSIDAAGPGVDPARYRAVGRQLEGLPAPMGTLSALPGGHGQALARGAARRRGAGGDRSGRGAAASPRRTGANGRPLTLPRRVRGSLREPRNSPRGSPGRGGRHRVPSVGRDRVRRGSAAQGSRFSSIAGRSHDMGGAREISPPKAHRGGCARGDGNRTRAARLRRAPEEGSDGPARCLRGRGESRSLVRGGCQPRRLSPSLGRHRRALGRAAARALLRRRFQPAPLGRAAPARRGSARPGGRFRRGRAPVRRAFGKHPVPARPARPRDSLPWPLGCIVRQADPDHRPSRVGLRRANRSSLRTAWPPGHPPADVGPQLSVARVAALSVSV